MLIIVKDVHGNTALHLAAACERSDLTSNPLEVIAMLLSAGAPPTYTTESGSSVLHLLCGEDEKESLCSSS